MNLAHRCVVLTVAFAIGLLGSVGLARADDIAWKAAHDTDPHLALTQEQLEIIAEKRMAEPTTGGMVPAQFVIPLSECGECGNDGGSYPSSASLVANQTPQAT